LAVAAVVCTAAASAGDISQDLKASYLLGATPWRQQVAQIIGIAASACVIGFVLILLNEAWGFGSKDLLAPQATLMKMIVEGVFNAQLPWVLSFRCHTLNNVGNLTNSHFTVAIGLYLPIHLSTPIMVGGLVRVYWIMP